MKKYFAVILLAVASIGIVSGCKTAGTNPAAIAPGARDQVDSDANEALQPAYAFAKRITSAVQSTDPAVHIELTAAQKNVLNELNKSINIAAALLQAYHATPDPASVANLKTATQKVNQDLGSAQTIITVPAN